MVDVKTDQIVCFLLRSLLGRQHGEKLFTFTVKQHNNKVNNLDTIGDDKINNCVACGSITARKAALKKIIYLYSKIPQNIVN